MLRGEGAYLQDQTKGGHTLVHHVALPACGQWYGSGPVSGCSGIDHHAHKISGIATVLQNLHYNQTMFSI